MATITATVLKENKKANDRWNVVFRLTHNRKSRYISTTKYVSAKDLDKQFKLKTSYIVKNLADDLITYEARLDAIKNIDKLSIDEVKSRIINDSQGVNLIEFIKQHIDKLNKAGRVGTTKPFLAVYNSLLDYIPGGYLDAADLKSKFLEDYEDFLRTPREIKRKAANVISTRTTSLSDRGLHNHMSALRTLFNEAKRAYNDEDNGEIIIKNNPFGKYVIKPKKKGEHRNLEIEVIRKVRDFKVDLISEKIGKDMFLLSLYLCGMNTVDIFKNYDLIKSIPERIGYSRSKTKGGRSDDAFISILVPEEAKEVIERIEMNYGKLTTLNFTISRGLTSIAKKLGLEKLQLYSARHSFASIARNECGISRDDIAMALNHVNDENRVTDIYIKPDWSIVDRVQRAVINKINEDL